MRKKIALILTLLLMPFAAQAATTLAEEDQTAAAILAYSRIGDDYNPENNLQTDQFAEQINTLMKGGYKILSLKDILDSYDRKKPLPQKAIAITFEGGHKSALKNAIPLLLKNNLPFTIFYAANRASNDSDDFMSWEDLKTLHKNKLVTLGILPADYSRLAGRPKLEVLDQLNKSKTKHREAFNEEPQFFAYPFGEYDSLLKSIVKEQGYRAAFGLNSGVASAYTDRFVMPRFTLTEEYGDADHFGLIINALPLPHENLEPQNPYLTTTTPNIGFTLHSDLIPYASDLRCFASDQANPTYEILGKSRIELRLKSPLSTERTRINCILPVKPGAPEDQTIKNWRWLGFLLIHPESE